MGMVHDGAMISRLLLLCGVLVLGGCGSARAAGYPTAASAELAPAAPPRSGAGEGVGYSGDEGAPDADRGADQVTTQALSLDSAAVTKKSGGESEAPSPAATAPHPLPGEPPVSPLDPNQETPTDQSRQPMLIYRARLGLAVFKVQEQLDTIEAMTQQLGGYLVARTQNEIRVRVPAQRFRETVDSILKLGDVNFRQVVTDDVTAEYTDLEIRLKNAVDVRERLQLLLDKVQKVQEAIEVERELARLTNEIETMKGRLKLLRELTAYSTIDVSFSERSSPLQSRVALPFPWLETLGLQHLLSL